WWDALGPADAGALMARDNQAAENAIRVNTLVADRAQIAGELRASDRASSALDEWLPEAVMLDAPLDLEATAQFMAGAITPQSRASMLVSRILDPEPGERVLDLCAAPGAKATHLAALIQNRGAVVAVERNAQRADELRDNCARM